MNKDYKYRFISKMSCPDYFGCIKYLGAISKTGYGVFDLDGKSLSAHRVSYELFVGKIPKGKFILHKCDNRKCIAPCHLFIGTQSDNIRDMKNKGRNNCGIGENQGNSKLNRKKVSSIKLLLGRGVKSKSIALRYKISESTVCDIKNNRTWKYL